MILNRRNVKREDEKVAELADDVIVMHDGEIVEKGRVLELFDSPQEEYTKRLLKASFEGAENCS